MEQSFYFVVYYPIFFSTYLVSAYYISGKEQMGVGSSLSNENSI